MGGRVGDFDSDVGGYRFLAFALTETHQHRRLRFQLNE